MTEHTEQKLLDFMPQPRWWHRYVSWLLYLANSDAPTWKNYRYAFYGLKDLILNSRAIECGVDWQRFTKPCWSCDGTGYFTHWSGDKELCNRCYASGVYSVYYVKLYRLSFGGRVFHKPGDSQNEKPDNDVEIIDGRIKHRRQGWRAVLAFVVLLAVFDRGKLWMLTRHWSWSRASKVARWFWRKTPCRCYKCRCLMLRMDAGSSITERTDNGVKRIGLLCYRCADDEVPF